MNTITNEMRRFQIPTVRKPLLPNKVGKRLGTMTMVTTIFNLYILFFVADMEICLTLNLLAILVSTLVGYYMWIVPMNR